MNPIAVSAVFVVISPIYGFQTPQHSGVIDAACVQPNAPAPVCDFNHSLQLLAADGSEGDFYGGAIDIDGDLILIGSDSDEPEGVGVWEHQQGSAYIFQGASGDWVQQAKLTASDPGFSDHFGTAVAIDGDVALIGAPFYDNPSTGTVFVFRKRNGVWLEVDQLKGSEVEAFDLFGTAIALDRNVVAIGSPENYGSLQTTGSVYIYGQQNNQWIEQQKILPSSSTHNQAFGNALAMEDGLLVVGAYNDGTLKSGAGAVYIFRYDGSSWYEEAKLTASDMAQSARFGSAVDVRANRILVGAPRHEDRGAVYVFTFDGGQWNQTQQLTPPTDLPNGAFFGTSVSLADTRLAVGATGYLTSELKVGAAFVYEKWCEDWKLTSQFIPTPGILNGERVGEALFIDERRLIVGAPSFSIDGAVHIVRPACQ